MPLFSERKRLAELAEREAKGESFWTNDIPRPARVKIAALWTAIEQTKMLTWIDPSLEADMEFRVQAGLGDYYAPCTPASWRKNDDADVLLSVLEALMQAVGRHEKPLAKMLENKINSIFTAHRVAFKSVDFEFIPFESDALHHDVVEPALRLLITENHTDAHASFLAALKQIAAGDAGNAITDAGSALQHTLEDLGCKGNALGPLWNDAKRRGLVASHDQKLLDGISKFVDWASADRSTTGDAHKNSTATLPDAWLMVHITGALILRLTDSAPRIETGLENVELS